MAISFDADASRRLLDALESFRKPQGEGLRSEVRGPVPQEAADAFRRLLAQEPSAAEAASPPEGVAAAAEASKPMQAGSAEGAAHLEADPSARTVGASDLTADAPQPAMTPEELLRTQFELNMHMFEAKSLLKVRDGAANEADQLLKSSN